MTTIRRLSTPQLYALHVASHYKLRRSSMGWWAENHPRWGVTQPVIIFSPATIKSLWRMGVLDGTPDSKIIGANDSSNDVSEIGLWTNERGKQTLRTIESDSGVYYNLETDELEDRYDATQSEGQEVRVVETANEAEGFEINIDLGSFATEKEAALAYDRAAILLYGEDADTNFRPEESEHVVFSDEIMRHINAAKSGRKLQ